jgi:hypothetical protein
VILTFTNFMLLHFAGVTDGIVRPSHIAGKTPASRVRPTQRG